ncbi:hypothetical protein HO133_001576 [Letharia lupina]|uniref:Uncharacterized protein n=2 Tax=Letharia TaxID=112415 RepID=A0A8H6CDH8_9LECA|nr:uncharacterized protein HO133_001576 [Letharia lupina]XP_037164538.1 uncharacterized protein HO173_006789 [Letharia columbiana]KAF6221610.1 hypothetical protein HO133_001576 [Letharia lupina]KAF6235160.1 hypothetical protein HO173_006789 [Letharia columbiana]
MLLIQNLSLGAALMTVGLASAQSSYPNTTTTLNTSTCSRQSIAACPTPYDPCCAFVCAEAQVPFDVCSPNNETFLASCYACTPATATPTVTTPPSSTGV